MKKKQRGLTAAPITIEEGAWLGAHVIVGPGVTIGARSVIGAGSVIVAIGSAFTGMLEAIEIFEPGTVLEAESTGKGYACGAPAVAAAMWAGRELGANRVQVLHHSTSGDETGDRSQVVGYGAAVMLKDA